MAKLLITGWLLAIAGLLPISTLAQVSERGQPVIALYPSIPIGGSALNSAVIELPDKKIAVANASAMLLFDGNRWRVIEHPEGKQKFNGLAVGDRGRIYSGVFDELGYFKFNSAGTPIWHSLMPSLPADVRGFGAVLRVVYDQQRQRVWYLTAKTLLLIDPVHPQNVQRWPTMVAFKRLFEVDGEIWVSAHDEGIQRALGQDRVRLEFVPGLEQPDFDNTVGVIADGQDRILLTAEGKSYRWSQGQVRRVGESLESELLAGLPVTMLRMGDGRFLIKLKRRPPCLVDAALTSMEYLPLHEGTAGNNLPGVALDAHGGIWLAQPNLISRVDMASALTYFDQRSGLSVAHELVRMNGALYVAAATGVHRLVPGNSERNAQFEPVWPQITSAYGLAVIGDTLFAAGAGLYRISDHAGAKAERIVDIPRVALVKASSFHPDRLWLATFQGVVQVNDASSQTPTQRRIEGIDTDIVQIVEEDSETLWAAGSAGGLWRIRINMKGTQVEAMEGRSGLAPRQVRLGAGRAGAWILTDAGVRRYDARTGIFFAPKDIPQQLVNSRVFSLLEDADGNLWFRSVSVGTGVAWRGRDGWRVDTTLFSAIDMTPTVTRFMREGSVVWAARSDGLLRLDLSRHLDPAAPEIPQLTALRDLHIGQSLPLVDKVALSSVQRNVGFEFALANSHRPLETLYRSRLLGFDQRWTDWSGRADRDYTNLPDGAFKFEVEARDSFGRTGSMPALSVSVAAPWWRTTWAYCAYAISAVILLWLAARLGARHRQRLLLVRQHELETVVDLRTQELKQKNLQLADQAERLTEVDRLKTRFFINVGHEFRTPLTLVLGPIDDLLRDARERLSARAREQLEMANRNARRVLDLIVELLDVNRFEHGQMRLTRTTMDLQELVQQVLNDHAALLDRYGHNSKQNVETDGPWLAVVDPAQISRCLTNLIGNAAKYMARGGLIELRLRRIGAEIEIAVIDQGRGIAAAALPHVYDRFFQAEGSDSASGYGIGLALVREIIEAHQGRVGVESVQGVGSTFLLMIPALEQISVGQAAMHVPQIVEPALAPTAVEHDDAAPAPVIKPLVLVVDDHDDLRARARGLLEDRFDVIEAADGPSAWNMARDRLPDLIVCDVMMPGFDGIELTRRLRANAETAAIALLLLTAKVGTEHAVAGLRAGADDYLAKPFDASELLARIDALLARAHRLQLRLAREQLPPPVIDTEETSDQRWRRRLDELIAQRMDDPEFGIEQLAQAIHADRSQLFRKCKELLSVSPSEYLRDTRLRRAHALLEQAAGSISEIAYAAGFDSLSSFTRAFKTRYGVPPSQIVATRRAG